MFVSIHIPKTAGTMLGFLFDFGSQRRILWDYSDTYANALQVDPHWIEHIDFIEAYFWGIHGHFFFKKYALMFPAATFISCIRHPVDRTVSQFKHEVYNAVTGQISWRTSAILDGTMDVVAFAKSDENVRRAQCVHLEGRAVEDYDFIFVQEHIAFSLERFSQHFGFHRRDPEMGRLPRVNDSAQRFFRHETQRQNFERLTVVTDAQRQALFGAMPEELELYERALDHWVKRLGV